MQDRRQAARASATKNQENTPYARTKTSQLLDDGMDDDMDDDDEETLQLKLAAIEARLKLKKLQQSKTKAKSSSFEAGANDTPDSPASRPPSRFLMERKRKAANISSHPENVQVPVSPSKRLAPSTDPVSPRRVVLGIDKGMKGSEVSLRRPPSSTASARPASSIGGYRDERFSRMGRPSTARSNASSTPSEGPQRPKSFSERIAESRSVEKSKREKAQLLQRKRTTAFAVDKNEMERLHTAAQESNKASSFDSPRRERHVEEFSREDVLQSYNRPHSGLRKSKSVTHIRESSPYTRPASTYGSSNHQKHERQNSFESRVLPPASSNGNIEDSSQDTENKPSDPSKFEPFSGLHLSNRILPHSFLTRTLESKTPLRIPDLLKTIKGPDFDPPDTDGDYVVFGIIASKSSPKEHNKEGKNSTKKPDLDDDGSNNSSKYMVITLTDLKWSIDLFLFSTAFPRYYKLTAGTVVAILNPSIMPPPPNKIDTNRFSLTLNSSDDTILEIGKAQDLGFCKSIRKDGKVCETWVDGRKTEFCEFHVDLQLRKTTSKRMEVNSGPGMFGPGGRSGSRTGMFGRSRSVREGGAGGNGLKPEGAQMDRSTGSTYYVAPPIPGRSAANLLDADDPFIAAANDFHRGGDAKLDRLQKRLAQQERERHIARSLGDSSSVGAEYLRHRQRANSTPGRERGEHPLIGSGNDNNRDGTPASTAQSARVALGLDATTRNANNVKLGPMAKVKNGGAVTKKTRFVTAKGIRDAGRDSLGGPADGQNAVDYDDDLDIV
ncbi:hypothetical protein FQN55_003585 [Onygenales sp. PD_40]|nr:hypothetical protein FQN55_003585 [Onygenales sp. PD_40]KAK2783783.1 hypothetical protein FQN53_008948 [Emmonsiellopsis sp. PD_33]KAK2802700.1 hypothetical protein FQN51_004224 [Onygenales sp. PD_10]